MSHPGAGKKKPLKKGGVAPPVNFKEEKEQIEDYYSPKVKKRILELGKFSFSGGRSGKTKVEELEMKLLNETARYKGEWSIDSKQRYGKGIQVWADGSVYQGYWKEGKAHGKGRLIHADGDVYEGEWEDDEANGTGTYYHTDGSKFVGNWK